MGIDELLEDAKHLSRSERRELAERLLADLRAEEPVSAEQRVKALDRFLELAGTAHSLSFDPTVDKE